jgi:hypothetical protein
MDKGKVFFICSEGPLYFSLIMHRRLILAFTGRAPPTQGQEWPGKGEKIDAEQERVLGFPSFQRP